MNVQRPREFTDAKQPGITLSGEALGENMRYWNTAYERTAPRRIYGCEAAGNYSEWRGAGREYAVLEWRLRMGTVKDLLIILIGTMSQKACWCIFWILNSGYHSSVLIVGKKGTSIFIPN